MVPWLIYSNIDVVMAFRDMFRCATTHVTGTLPAHVRDDYHTDDE